MNITENNWILPLAGEEPTSSTPKELVRQMVLQVEMQMAPTPQFHETINEHLPSFFTKKKVAELKMDAKAQGLDPTLSTKSRLVTTLAHHWKKQLAAIGA